MPKTAPSIPPATLDAQVPDAARAAPDTLETVPDGDCDATTPIRFDLRLGSGQIGGSEPQGSGTSLTDHCAEADIQSELDHIRILEAAIQTALAGGREIVACAMEQAHWQAVTDALDRIIRFNTRIEEEGELAGLRMESRKGFSHMAAALQEYVTEAAASGRIRAALQAVNIGIAHVLDGVARGPATLGSELKHLHRVSTLIRSARIYWALFCRQEGRQEAADRILAKPPDRR